MSNTDNVQEIPVDSVTRDMAFQVRNQVDTKLVRQYAKAMENGASFPPIRLGQIGEALVIVDGWHRHAAAHSLGRSTIDAIVLPMTRREALLASALVNAIHGKPLKPAERQSAFKNFINGHGHKKANGSMLSYREISEALGGHVGHTTIYGWMRKEFPGIANAMGVEASRGKGNGKPPPIDHESEYRQQIGVAISDAMQLYKLLTIPDNRYDIIQQVDKMLAEMKIAEHWSVGF